MIIVIGFMFAGVALGFLLRHRNVTWISKLTTVMVWLLLFLLGVEVGGNDKIISSLPTLGVEALLIAVFATLGSCAAAWILWKYLTNHGE